MSKAYETVRDFALPASILFATLVLAAMFRFDVRPDGGWLLIHDRLADTVTLCGRNGACFEALGARC